jgi:hypothetical protein
MAGSSDHGVRATNQNPRKYPAYPAEKYRHPQARKSVPCRSIDGTNQSMASPIPSQIPPKKRRLLSRTGASGSLLMVAKQPVGLMKR